MNSIKNISLEDAYTPYPMDQYIRVAASDDISQVFFSKTDNAGVK